MVRLEEVARETNQRASAAPQAEVFSVTKHSGFVRSLDYFDRQVFSRDTGNYKVVRRGDLAYATIHLDEGSLGILRDADFGLISPMYTVFEPDSSQAAPEYLFALMKLPQMVARYQRIGEGTVHRRKSISFARLGRLGFAIPSLSEQRSILAVLDSIDEAIERTDEVIAATERLRDALLHELLTRGLPGHHTAWREVRGLGTIPACWEVVRLGDVCEVISGYAMGPQRAPQDHPRPYLTVANVHTDRVTVGELRYMELTDAEYASRSLRAGDLVVVEGHAQLSQLGRAAVVPPDAAGFAFQNHLFRVRLLGHGDLQFVCASMNGPRGRAYFASFGGTTSGLNTVSARNLRLLPLPWPGDTEQQAIAATLSSVDDAVERAREERAALQSSKASTADALLTGRVRAPLLKG